MPSGFELGKESTPQEIESLSLPAFVEPRMREDGKGGKEQEESTASPSIVWEAEQWKVSQSPHGHERGSPSSASKDGKAHPHTLIWWSSLIRTMQKHRGGEQHWERVDR